MRSKSRVEQLPRQGKINLACYEARAVQIHRRRRQSQFLVFRGEEGSLRDVGSFGRCLSSTVTFLTITFLNESEFFGLRERFDVGSVEGEGGFE